jgi:ribosomal-protein-alanine N-acetyltransferase
MEAWVFIDRMTLRTRRLLLRRWLPSDRVPFAALNADAEVMRHFPAVLSRAESDEVADRIERNLERLGIGMWAVEVPGVTRFAGCVGLSIPAFDAPFAHHTPCIELGWRFAREHWNQGYATEGAQAAVSLAFDTLHIPELVAFTVPQNAASRRVAEKLGMTRDPAEDFDHPRLPVGHALRRHVLYRLRPPL